MPVIIEEVVADAIKPAATPKPEQPVTEVAADLRNQSREVMAEIRRAEARAQRLRAD